MGPETENSPLKIVEFQGFTYVNPLVAFGVM